MKYFAVGLLIFVAVALVSFPRPLRGGPYQITIDPNIRLPGLTRSEVYAAIAGGLREWESACNVRFVRSKKRRPFFRITTGRLADRTGLGRTVLGRCERGVIKLNRGVTWSFGELRSVVAHEVGHALGWHHSDDPRDLMYHANDKGGQRLSPRERRRAVIQFGQRLPASPRPSAK